jgi:hypothetical protein
MENNIYSHVLIMKVGPYCDYSLDEIIKIKQEEERKLGKFFWGYGGVFCRPNVINDFLYHARVHKKKPIVMFSTTLSAYNTNAGGKFSEYSIDKAFWYKIPEEVLLVGNQDAPHFAIIAKNLKKVDMHINLSDYCSYVGILPNENKYLDTYLRYRVDKACGYYSPKSINNDKLIKIDYIGELVDPYCVFIR